jgi:hypothetical protein
MPLWHQLVECLVLLLWIAQHPNRKARDALIKMVAFLGAIHRVQLEMECYSWKCPLCRLVVGCDKEGSSVFCIVVMVYIWREFRPFLCGLMNWRMWYMNIIWAKEEEDMYRRSMYYKLALTATSRNVQDLCWLDVSDWRTQCIQSTFSLEWGNLCKGSEEMSEIGHEYGFAKQKYQWMCQRSVDNHGH